MAQLKPIAGQTYYIGVRRPGAGNGIFFMCRVGSDSADVKRCWRQLQDDMMEFVTFDGPAVEQEVNAIASLLYLISTPYEVEWYSIERMRSIGYDV